MADGKIIQGVRWIADAAGRIVGYRNPVSDKDEDLNAAALQGVVSGAGKQSAPKNNDPAAVRAAVYPMTDGSGSTLAEQSGRGPSISVGGTVTGAWANAGWFSHDAAGNTLKLAGNSYIEGLIDMSGECTVLVGCDLRLNAAPSTTETAWSMHRPDTTAGGFRFPLPSSWAGRIGLYYRPNGGGSNSEVIGYTMPAGERLQQRISTLFEINVVPARGEMNLGMWVNGRMQRGGTFTLGTPPVSDAGGGMSFSGEGVSSLNKLGTGGSGARSALCYVARHSGRDRNIAGRLAAHVWANRSLPNWLNRI